MLDERPVVDLTLHDIARGEMVMHAIHFARARATRRVAHRETKRARVFLHELVDECALARA